MNWVVLIIGILVALIALIGIRIVRPVEKGVVERLGKFDRIAEQGFHWIIPIIDKMIYVNVTERMADVKPQSIITEDNLNAEVDLMVYYKVKPDADNIKKSIYSVNDFVRQIISLAQTTARNVIGDMKFIDVNNKRNELNSELAKVLDKQSYAWGVQIVRVELKEITPPEDVQETMNRVIKAENEKDAATDFATATETKADGERRAAIKKAEGEKRAEILEAEGQAKAIVTVAQARAEKIKLVNESIQKHFKKEAQVFKKLETVEKALQKGTKFVIDSKSNIMNVMCESAGVTPLPLSRKKK